MQLPIISALILSSGLFPPPAGLEGSTAIHKDDSSIVAWADSVHDYQSGQGIDVAWTDTSQALGPAEGNVYAVTSLGRSGSITLSFSDAISNGEGWDFVVFGNSFDDYFLELAFVEVSSNGRDFVRFPNRSLTDQPVPAFGQVDATQITGLAGKYRVGYGTPFDLDELAGIPGLDISHIRYVRIIDVVGNGSTFDSEGHPVYSPYPTISSAGFDLDAIGVIHQGFLRGVLHDDSGVWSWHQNFGWYYGAYYPWIFYPEHDWLLIHPTAPDSFWFWQAEHGWSWTDGKSFPMVWNENTGWILF